MSRLPRTVVLLGVVSLFTDVSSEMIVPLLPLLLLQGLGATPAFVGIVDGAAEAVASIGKLGSGLLADRTPRQKPLVIAGYSVSALMRPLVSFAAAPLQVLGIRVLDRVGKGLRTSPRDVMLAASAPADSRARAFGFHRGMDHLGAAIGPLIALALLSLGFGLREIFLWSAVPGVLGVLLLFAVREPPRESQPASGAPRLPTREAVRNLGPVLGVIALVALGTGSDAFLVVRLAGVGGTEELVPVLWLVLHLVRASLSTPGGALADRLGHVRVLSLSLVAGACAYAGLAMASSSVAVIALAGAWGLRAALGEGAERALFVELSGGGERGRALGLYYLTLGIVALPAGAAFGWVYQALSPHAAYGIGAGLLAVASMLVGPAARRSRSRGA